MIEYDFFIFYETDCIKQPARAKHRIGFKSFISDKY